MIWLRRKKQQDVKKQQDIEYERWKANYEAERARDAALVMAEIRHMERMRFSLIPGVKVYKRSDPSIVGTVLECYWDNGVENADMINVQFEDGDEWMHVRRLNTVE